MDLTFEAPPEGPRVRKNALVELAQQLRARPNEWAILKRNRNMGAAYSWVARARRGDPDTFIVGEYEFRAVEVDGEARVYGRYVGSSAA